jgi:cytochrome c oxidase subunit 4
VSETYKPEAPAHPKTAKPQEHHSATPYVLVWIALGILTIVTVLTGKQHLGAIALPLALTIATVKSLLVLIFFMHLKEQKGIYAMIIAVSVAFALLLMGMTLTDVATRFTPLTPAGAPFGAKVILPTGDEAGASTAGEKSER